MRAGLGRNVVANMVNAAAQIGAALVGVPLILAAVGTSGYGVWTLAQTVLVYVATAEAGLGPGVQRFSAVSHARRSGDAVRRLLWTSLLFYVVLGLVVCVLAYTLAPALADVFNLDPAERDDAISMFRLMGPIVLLALLGAGLGNVQQGTDRFLSFAGTSVAGSATYLVGLVVVASQDGDLVAIGYVALAQQLATVVLRAVVMHRLLLTRPRLMAWTETKEILAFSARLQMSVLSTLVNNQTDKLVVGVLRTPAAVGQLGIGAQIGEAGRLVGGAALSPLVTRFSGAHVTDTEADARALYTRINRFWFALVIGSIVIGLAVIEPLIRGWLGDGYEQAALLGALLVLAYGMSLLAGVSVAFMRAIGKPGLEARYSGLVIVLNVSATVVLGLLFGTIGVVAATAIAYFTATLWFFRGVARQVPGAFDGVGRLLAGILPRAVVVAAVAAVACLGLVRVLPTGVGLLGVAAVAGLALAGYLVWTGEHPREIRWLPGGRAWDA